MPQGLAARCRATTTRRSCSTSTSAACRTSTGWRATATRTPVDLVVVGAGAGGVMLAQRLARKGWRDRRPREGAVLGSRPRLGQRREGRGRPLLDRQARRSRGSDPIEMGKNNSGVGVGGSMTHFAGYVPRFHPSDFEVRTRDGVGVDWPISYWDLKASFERVERELPVAGRVLAVGRPARLPARRRIPISGAAVDGVAGRARTTASRCASAPSSITNGVFGNRPHCIYRGFCLEGCKVNAKALAADHASARRDRARRARCAPTRWSTRVELDDATGRCTGVALRHATGASASSAPTPSPSAATRSRRRGCCSTRPAPRHPHGLGNNNDQVGRYVMVQGATQIGGALPASCCGCTRRRRRRSPRSSSTRPTSAAASRAASRSRRSRRSRSAGPSTCSPRGTGAQRCASTCATTTTGRVLGVLVRVPAAAREPRHARRRQGSRTGCPSRTSTTASARTTRRSSRTRRRSSQEIWDGADAQDTLTIDRYAHLVGGCRMGFSPEDSVVDATTASGTCRTSSSSTAGVADPGRREPGARDHGARRPAGRAARQASASTPPRRRARIPPTLSNPRDLFLQLLREALWIERTLSD